MRSQQKTTGILGDVDASSMSTRARITFFPLRGSLQYTGAMSSSTWFPANALAGRFPSGACALPESARMITMITDTAT